MNFRRIPPNNRPSLAISASPLPLPCRVTGPGGFLSGIDALLPAIRDRAAAVEHDGVVSREVIGWLTDAGIFRAVQPRQWGGLELHAGIFVEGALGVASACGSTGRVASVVGIHPRHVAMFHPEA